MRWRSSCRRSASAVWSSTIFGGAPSSWPERTDSVISPSSSANLNSLPTRVRLFLAVNLPADVRHAIAHAATPLRAVAPGLSWVNEEKVHLTVKFLGQQPAVMAERVATAMREIAARNRVIDVEVGGVGAFPNFRRPRVVWIGVTPEPKLELLHHDVESSCESLGLPIDGKPFRPHLTLARVRPRASDPQTLRELAHAARAVSYVEEVVITSIDLMESTHTASGSVYRIVASAALRD